MRLPVLHIPLVLLIVLSSTGCGGGRSVCTDLTPTICSGPLSATLGAVINVTSGVKNSGQYNAGAFRIGIYLSTDIDISPAADTLIGSRNVTSLTQNSESVAVTPATIPAETPPGTYYLGIIADDKNTVNETSDDNNALASFAQIAVNAASAIDLSIMSFTAPPAADIDISITVNAEVLNSGTASAGPFTVSVYISTDSEITVADALVGSHVTQSLDGGTTDTSDITVTIPYAIGADTYHIGAIVDSAGSVTETDETNNSYAAATIAVGGLQPLDSYEYDNSSFASTPLILDGDVQDHTIHNYLDNDWFVITVSGNTGIRLNVTSVSGLSFLEMRLFLSYATSSSVSNLIYPWEYVLPDGTYYIRIESLLPEAGSYTISLESTGAPLERDLEANDARTTQLETLPGGYVTCYSSYNITGNTFIPPPTDVTFYLSTDDTLSGDDVLLGGHTIEGGVPGNTLNVQTRCRIPGDTSSGPHWICHVVDPDDTISETDELNNTATNSGIVYVSPDVVVNSITVPGAADTGEQVTVNWDISTYPSGYEAPQVNIYLSTDTALDAADVCVKTLGYVSGTGTADFQLAGNFTPGTYYALLVANPTQYFPEADYTNNTAVSDSIVISAVPHPDLVVTSLSGNPAVVDYLGTITVDDVVLNQGTAAAGALMIGYYFVEDLEPEKMRQRKFIGERIVTALNAGIEDNGSILLQLSGAVYPGVYYLVAMSDDYDDVLELDESNNIYVAAEMIYVLGAEHNDAQNNCPCLHGYLPLVSTKISNHTIHQPGDVDWLRVSVQAGNTVRFETMNLTTGMDTIMELWSTDNDYNPVAMLAIDDDSGSKPGASAIVLTFSEDGLCLVRIYHKNPNGTGAYWFRRSAQ